MFGISLVISVLAVLFFISQPRRGVFDNNLDALASGESILPIPCHKQVFGGTEITYPICHKDTEDGHITYCLFFGIGYESLQCADVFF